MDSQLKTKNRMNRSSKDDNRKADKKRSSSRINNKKRGAPKDDDEDVDSRGNVRGLIAYTESEAEFTESEPEESPKHRSSRRGGFKPRRREAAVKAEKKIKKKLSKRVVESESEEEDEDYDEDEDEETPTTLSGEEEDEDEDEEDEEDEEDDGPQRGILLNFGFGGEGPDERMVPKRYKIKKESEIIQKFFKLMTTPIETETIDDHIDQFKALKDDDQKRMIVALENRPKAKDQPVMFKILNMKTTPEIQAQLLAKYNNLQALDPTSGEYYKMRNWLEKATALPLGVRKEMPVKVEDGPDVCQAFMTRAKRCLDEAIYGQDEAKLQILQFIASKITNPQARGMSLLLIGPPGIGKTSLIKQGIAKALDWPFQFISLGGDSDASTFNGHQMVYEGSHCGKIVNSLVAAKSMSMVLMFDELDKVSTTAKGEEIQNLLVHLTDPTQNADFEDKYLAGIPLDLSQAMFVFSGNDISKIDKVLLDRFLVVQLEGYGPKEKMEIAEKFLLPGALKEVNLAERVGIPKDVVSHILDTYAKEEQGVRELKRCMEQIAQKLNMLRLFNSPDLPFHIKDFSLPFILKKEHIDRFLKEKRPSMDISAQRMYT
jgi:ATP-dependent Clp protease ATP-binding subunit ClpA